MAADPIQIYDKLFRYCEAESFAGFDPFDGLESRIFQASPFKHFAPARLAWIQTVKRSPVNLRPMLAVPKGINSKAIALFASAELSRFRMTNDNKHRENARKLLEMLRGQAINGTAESGNRTTAFGYDFDWQSRAFYALKRTPSIVPTAFAAKAFVHNALSFGEDDDLSIAKQICEFIISDLQRPHETDEEICFSYTPGDSSQIYNASLLAGETLAVVGSITDNDSYLELAEKTARYVIRGQRNDGAWTYGPKLRHGWIDNFHTAFILGSLNRLAEHVPQIYENAQVSIKRGFEYWITNFFLDDGAPKYFDSQTYPLDIHSAATAIAALADFAYLDERAVPMAETVLEWTLRNMHDEAGYFYYQKRKSSTVKIAFIRWGQAWMAYAIAKLMEARSNA